MRGLLFLCLCWLLVLKVSAFPSSNPTSHIVGGVAVPITSYPYQVSMRINGNHICGASIISTSWVITAAHCVDTSFALSETSFRVGSANRTQGGTVVTTTQRIVHPNYNANSHDYDVAVYKLATVLNFTLSIAKIALPTATTTVAVNTMCTVSGWGTLSSGGTTSPIMLMAVSVPTVSTTSCKTSYGSTSITARMICAGYTAGGKDSCQGDSGGPMVATLSGVKTLVGIVSWGKECALANYPGIYTFTPAVRSWIKTTTAV